MSHPVGGNNGTEPVDEGIDSLYLSSDYVHSLVSLGLERLQLEPSRLRSEAAEVDQALHSLSLDHYGVFIQNQECVRHVKSQGSAMDTHLSSLLTEVDGLSSEFGSFQREAAELINGLKRNRQTLKHHMQLVELLEVPQLMDACVRNDLYQEALSLATFAGTLERRHWDRRLPSRENSEDPIVKELGGLGAAGKTTGEDHVPGVVRMLVKEVRESTVGLHERLLAKLRGPIQLTTSLQIVSCLRQLELLALEEKKQRRQNASRLVVTTVAATGVSRCGTGGSRGGGGVTPEQLRMVEMKLQVDFLEARDVWLESVMDSAKGRVGLDGDLGTGSRTKASPYQVSRLNIHGVGHALPDFGLPPLGSQATPQREEVLSSWLHRKVSGFLDKLRGLLPLIGDGSSVRNLLDECMFFGASMGRLGTDFRGLLAPIFEERVWSVAAGQWAAAAAEFGSALQELSANEAPSSNSATPLHVALKPLPGTREGGGGGKGSRHDGGEGISGAWTASTATEKDVLNVPSPPRSLIAFPLLARFVNRLLASFNQLRECLPLSLEPRLTEMLYCCFEGTFQALSNLKSDTVRRASTGGRGSDNGDKHTKAPGVVGAGSGITLMALGLACDAMAGEVVPHVALCFVALFGGGTAAGAHETLCNRLLCAMEELRIHERLTPPSVSDIHSGTPLTNLHQSSDKTSPSSGQASLSHGGEKNDAAMSVAAIVPPTPSTLEMGVVEEAELPKSTGSVQIGEEDEDGGERDNRGSILGDGEEASSLVENGGRGGGPGESSL